MSASAMDSTLSGPVCSHLAAAAAENPENYELFIKYYGGCFICNKRCISCGLDGHYFDKRADRRHYYCLQCLPYDSKAKVPIVEIKFQ